VPKDWIGKTIGEIMPRTKYGIEILAIKRQKEVKALPNAEEVFRTDDKLVAAGTNKNIQKFQKVLNA